MNSNRTDQTVKYAQTFGEGSVYEAVAAYASALKAAKKQPFIDSQLRLFCAGLKPGINIANSLNAEDIADLIAAIHRNRIHVSAFGDVGKDIVIVRDVAVEYRAFTEPEAAAFVGYDADVDAAENLARAKLYYTASPEAQALASFARGNPFSSIRGLKREIALRQGGLPNQNTIENLHAALRGDGASVALRDILERLRTESGGVWLTDGLTIDDALAALAAANMAEADAIDAYYERGEDPPASEQVYLRNERSAAVAPIVAEIYRVAYGASDDDAAFMASRRTHNIAAPEGGDGYSFPVYEHEGYGGASAPDVKALEARIASDYPTKA